MRHGWIRGAVLAGVMLTVALAAPVGAITNGQLDDGEHPYVGQLLSYVPDEADGSWFNCTGTLLNATVVLTAGHCTFGTGLDGNATTEDGGWGGNDVWVSFEAEPDYTGISSADSYASIRDTLNANDTWNRGTAYPQPAYVNELFYLHDAGVVILDEPYNPPGIVDNAVLPEVGALDEILGRDKPQTLFESVGYGFERLLPVGAFGGDTRMKSEQVIVNRNGVYGVHDDSSIVFSNNNGKPHRGGTCSGDSGGPYLLDDDNNIIQVAVNSYARQPNCTGGDGGYRLDQEDVLNWLHWVLQGNPPREVPG